MPVGDEVHRKSQSCPQHMRLEESCVGVDSSFSEVIPTGLHAHALVPLADKRQVDLVPRYRRLVGLLVTSRAMPSPWNAARDLSRLCGHSRVGMGQLIALVMAWSAAGLLAWYFSHPNLDALKANGLGLWMDGHAYWMAWRHLDLYGLAPRDLDAYLYSPAFAEALHPLTLLPFAAFAAVWWGVLVAAFWWLLKPLAWFWRIPALVLTGFEVQVGNINALLAVMLVLAVRFPGVWSLALLTKITPGIGLLWYVARGEWRKLGCALGFTAVIVLVSLPLGPHLWIDWLVFLEQSRHGPAGDGLLNAGTLPVRLLAAAAMVIWGARSNKPWVLAVAVPLATPLIGLATVTVLAALPRLVLQGHRGVHQGGVLPIPEQNT
jgi:hypothetical protein